MKVSRFANKSLHHLSKHVICSDVCNCLSLSIFYLLNFPSMIHLAKSSKLMSIIMDLHVCKLKKDVSARFLDLFGTSVFADVGSMLESFGFNFNVSSDWCVHECSVVFYIDFVGSWCPKSKDVEHHFQQMFRFCSRGGLPPLGPPDSRNPNGSPKQWIVPKATP